MTQFLKKLKVWLAKLAFRRKRAADAAPRPEAEPAPSAAVDVAERKPKTTATEEPEVPEPKPSILTRLKQGLTFRRKPVEAEAETDAEVVVERKPRARASEEPEVPAPKPGFLTRLKQWLSFRRKPAETDAETDDKTLVIDKSKVRSETTAAEDEEAAPPPSRLKRLLIRLRNKWIWIPALSLAVVGLVSWVVVIMMHTTHEKERLQAELKAAKKMLEQKSVAAVKPPAPPPLSIPTEPVPVKPEKKIDPAFAIVGHVPAPQPEESGINTSDCVVKDKVSVAENLKNCITSFNDAVANSPNKPKKP